MAGVDPIDDSVWPSGIGIEMTDEGLYGNIYLQCQWGGCGTCEPYPPYTPPEGWDVWRGDWFCDVHIRQARMEDLWDSDVVWTVTRRWAGDPHGCRAVVLPKGRPWTHEMERWLRRQSP